MPLVALSKFVDFSYSHLFFPLLLNSLLKDYSYIFAKSTKISLF